MPKLASSISGGESKSQVTRETAAAALHVSSGADVGECCGTVISAVGRADEAHAPAESALLRVRDGVGFLGLFGAALRRDGSTKGSSNPKAAAAKGAPRAGSRRMPAGKTAVVVAVLPAGKVVVQERRRGWRRPAAGARVFASEAVGAAEPVSPKVSCFGAVRSERRAAPPPPGKQAEVEAEERGGCWASLTATVRRLCWNVDPRAGEPSEASESSSTSTASTPESASDAVLSPPRPVTGLGDVKRLASRRWAETLAAGEGRPFGVV